MAQNDTKLLPKVLLAGTSACIADALTFPLDTAKVRLQVQGEGVALKKQYSGMINTIVTIARKEGVRNLYNGLAAGLQRQMCFASVRIGMYDTTRDFYKRQFGVTGFGSGMDVTMRVLAGITTGGMAVLFAQPTDVVKVRMQAQQGGTKRYSGALDAYRKIAVHEGRAGLWQGTVPNIARNAIVNVAEIVCYDLIKDTILHLHLLEDNIVCHFTSAFAAGFITTVVASPVDVVKTRYMNSEPGTYRGAIHCAIRMGRSEGFTAFYKGFVPSFSRLVSWNILMWVTYEQMKILANKITHDINLNKSTPRIVTSSTGLGMEELF